MAEPRLGGSFALALRGVAILAALVYVAFRASLPPASSPEPSVAPAASPSAPAASRTESPNAKANALFIEAREKGRDRSRQGTAASIDLLRKAVRLDPKFTRAYAELAVAYGAVATSTDPLVRRPRAKAAADRAMAIDKAAAPALAALAFVHYRFEWQWTQAEAEFAKAVAADPDDAFAHHQYGVFLAAIGRTDDALRELGRAAELEPDSLAIRADMVAPFLRAGRVADARAAVNAFAAASPNGLLLHQLQADVFAAEGRTDAGDVTRMTERRIRQLTAELEGGPSPPKSYRLATDLALAHASLKHRDQTLQWLAVAIDLHEDAPLYMRSSPAFDFVRETPRFKELLRRAKMSSEANSGR